MNTPQSIRKSQIEKLHFVQTEVLTNENMIQARWKKIVHAIQLSTLFNEQVRIIFKTEEGIQSVMTRIREITKQGILLTGGIIIPICCIQEIERNGASL